jgi:hypothetical protein
MQNNPSGNDPRTIWQSQTREISTMTLEKMIHRRAQELHAKTVRERLGSLAGPACTIVLFALGVAIGDNPVQRVAFAIAVAWSLAGAYVLNRGMWQGRLAGDAAWATGLEFCRREIERGIYVQRRFLLWVFAPIVLGLGALVVPQLGSGFGSGGTIAKMSPFLTLFALWVILMFVFRRARSKELRREIDDLNDIERENRL